MKQTDAVLAYGIIDKYELEDNCSFFNQKKEQNIQIKKRNILVFDYGRGNFEVICLKLIKEGEEPEFIIKRLLGVDNFDDILIEHCIKIFEKKYPMKTKTKRIKIY